LLDQAAPSAPIGDPECARFLDVRHGAHERHWDVALRTERRSHVTTKLKYVVSRITLLIVARYHRPLDLLRRLKS
jgi:hypothetical protein